MAQPLHIISLGAGVQSSTMALMAARGEITPMPDCAIFADTGAEPRKVYEWLDWLEQQLPFAVHRVMHKSGLREEIIAAAGGLSRASNPPFFTGSAVGGGMLRRTCTGDYKVAPIRRKVRELMRAAGARSVTQWIGISTDEAHRMKPSSVQYVYHRWPLIEAGISRGACLQWMQRNSFPMPPKSACTFCPYHSDEMWQEMRDNDAESWREAVHIDTLIRPGFAGSKEQLFVHRQRVPLEKVKLQTASAAGQTDMWAEECEGMCGV